jgi:catechol 2,3-dioxygenase-like lactoylglutathione lyase family enzyme
MSKDASRFVNVCPVFLSGDVKRTVDFYTEKLGFQSAKHFDATENFAALYRDEIEFVIVQAKQGRIASNLQRYGAGYDAYIDTATPEGIDPIYEEFRAKGVRIVSEPHTTTYGSYEFVFEDIDGRYIGVGRIVDKMVFFKDSDRVGRRNEWGD